MRRPALLAALCFTIGILLQVTCVFPLIWMLMGALSGLFFTLLVFVKSQEKLGSVLLCILMVFLGALRFDLAVNNLLPSHYFHLIRGDEVLIGGRLVSEPEVQRRGWRAEMEITRFGRADTTWHTTGRMLVRFGEHVPLAAYGDRLVIRVVPALPEPARNPGGFDYRRYLSLRGIRALAYVKLPKQVVRHQPQQGLAWMQGIVPVRLHIKQTIEQNLSGGPAGLLKGILLGDKRAVPDQVREAFTRCGVNHVLAVSGLHVGLIASVIFFGLKLCGMGRCVTAWTTVFLLVVYALVTGLPPSVIRASLMAGVVILGSLGDWETDGWNALGFAGLVGLIVRPGDVLDVGFQLSFAATGGIFLFYRPILDLLPKWGGRVLTNTVWAPLAVSLAAQLATMPFIITYFGIVSVVGIVANLIVVPLIGLAAALGVVSVFVFLLSPYVVIWLNGANWILLKLAIGLSHMMASAWWAAFDVPQLPLYLWGIYGLLILLFLPRLRVRPFGGIILCGVLVCANVAVWQPILVPRDYLEMFVLDIGQGDAIFIRFPNNKTMLVDGGIRTQHQDMGERVVLPFLRSQGIGHIDVVVGSHAHSDHIGGLISVLERVSVGHYVDSGQIANTWTSREVQRLIKKNNVQYHAVAAGDSLVGLGGVSALVLHPAPTFVSDEEGASHGLNNGSVVMRLAYEGRKILLTGDIEHETDEALLRWKGRLQSDILKAAHHGSRTSSTQDFLEGVRARWVAVSCGIKNKFKHPSPEVIDRYDQMGMVVSRTDLGGAIRYVIDKNKIEVTSWVDIEP